MSLTGEMPRAGESALAPGESCAHCGTPLREDQEWCLECGAARTIVHRSPDWRIAAAVIATVVGLALLAFAIALVNLSGSADQAASTPASAAPASAATAPSVIGSWPVGLSGWTVDLARSQSHATADATATRFAAAGLRVGVLDSSQHPTMKPGYWIVFSGRYPDRPQAATAAAALAGKVPGTPVSRRVAPPGGL